jgi:pimeloyl-ACP methyl ester carboxylesterase
MNIVPPRDRAEAGLDDWRETPIPVSRSFTSQRLQLHYVDWGNPRAPLLLLIHGKRDHCRSWDWVASELRHDWHVVAPDLRGHGDSGWASDGNYGTASFLCDLARLVVELGASQVVIVGHSLGSSIAQRYAAIYPEYVRKLVAIEGFGQSPAVTAERTSKPIAAQWRDWINARQAVANRSPRRYLTFDGALARLRAANEYLTPSQAWHLALHGLNRNEDGSFSWKFDPGLNVSPVLDLPLADRKALWRAISCPALLLSGADSWAANPSRENYLQYFRDARFVEFEDAGHWLHHSQSARFMAELRAFL